MPMNEFCAYDPVQNATSKAVDKMERKRFMRRIGLSFLSDENKEIIDFSTNYRVNLYA